MSRGSIHEQANSIRVGFAVAFFVVLAPAASSAADLPAGELLADKWCAECHGVRRGRLGPNLAAPTFPELAAELSITAYSLRALRAPHETLPQITFTPGEMEDIVGYIMSFKPRRS